MTDAEALVIATEWNEFANVDLAVVKEKMRTPIVFDGRNLLDPETMRQTRISLLFDWTRQREAAVTIFQNMAQRSARQIALTALAHCGEKKSALPIPLSQTLSRRRSSLLPIARLPWNCFMASCAI